MKNQSLIFFSFLLMLGQLHTQTAKPKAAPAGRPQPKAAPAGRPQPKAAPAGKPPKKTQDQILIESALKNNIQGVKRAYVVGKLSADAVYGYSPTVLQIAISNNNLELVNLAISRGANLDLINNKVAPLHIAAALEREKIITLLLRRRANPSIRDARGVTPLEIAVAKEDLKTIKALMLPSNLKDINATPLHLAVIKNQASEVMKLLKERKYTYLADDKGYLPLHYAVVHSTPEIVKQMLPFYDINEKTYSGMSSILLIAKYNRVDMLPILLDANASLLDRDNKGNTPLHVAVLANAVDTARKLITLNAPTKEVNALGKTPLDVAQNPVLKRILLACFELPVAAERGNMALVKKLISQGGYVDIANEQGNRPIHLATEKGHTDTVKMLVSLRARVNVTNMQGDTPMHIAAARGFTNIIRTLAKAKANINVRNRQLELPVHLAIRNDFRDSVVLLTNLKTEMYDGVGVYLANSAIPKPVPFNTATNLEAIIANAKKEEQVLKGSQKKGTVVTKSEPKTLTKVISTVKTNSTVVGKKVTSRAVKAMPMMKTSQEDPKVGAGKKPDPKAKPSAKAVGKKPDPKAKPPAKAVGKKPDPKAKPPAKK